MGGDANMVVGNFPKACEVFGSLNKFHSLQISFPLGRVGYKSTSWSDHGVQALWSSLALWLKGSISGRFNFVFAWLTLLGMFIACAEIQSRAT